MSKARLVITSIEVEGRTPAEVIAEYGVSRSWLYELLTHHHQLTLSRATINRILVRAGAVVPEPAKRPKSSYLRFEASMPNETWQSDRTHYRLTRPDGTPGADTEIISWLDDHARYALHISAHHQSTGPIVADTFRGTRDRHRYPASTLTHNGMAYTVRFSGGRGGMPRSDFNCSKSSIRRNLAANLTGSSQSPVLLRTTSAPAASCWA